MVLIALIPILGTIVLIVLWAQEGNPGPALAPVASERAIRDNLSLDGRLAKRFRSFRAPPLSGGVRNTLSIACAHAFWFPGERTASGRVCAG